MSAWWQAFLLTQLVEVPIYLYGARTLPTVSRIVLALGASAVTHPIVWFIFPWHEWPFLPTALVAEAFAIATEALLAHLAGLRRAIVWSFVANAASMMIGLALRSLIV